MGIGRDGSATLDTVAQTVAAVASPIACERLCRQWIGESGDLDWHSPRHTIMKIKAIHRL